MQSFSSEEIIINVMPREVRVALLENSLLQEIHIERSMSAGLLGNIYKGRVKRILPGMQAAFIDIGLERAAFLHIADMIQINSTEEEIHNICISKLLTEQQEIIVQVIKDELGSKGARLTTCLSISSRYLVYMPTLNHIGVSQRIEDEEERERLKTILMEDNNEDPGNYIIRTAAEGANSLKADKQYVEKIWAEIEAKIKTKKVGELIHSELPLTLQFIRDSVSIGTQKILVDNQDELNEIKEFVEKFIPEISNKVELYNDERPIFDLFNIEEEIQKALQREVSLKSGGYLVFDQNEAMSTVDVNTGKFVGHKNLEETIFKTNLEAAQTIARQIRLRNIGGIIIIDFIDMVREEHRKEVFRVFEKAISKDHVKVKISEISSLGLVEMTRKRTHESLENYLCEPCELCNGRGIIKSSETVCYEIFRDILRTAKSYDASGLLVLASQNVVDRLLDEESAYVADLEDEINKVIKFQVESFYNPEQFDVVPISLSPRRN